MIGCSCWWFPDCIIDFFVPALPFTFIWIDVVIEDGEVARENRLDVSHNRVKCFATCFIKSTSE